MNDLTSGDKGKSCCGSEDVAAACCQSAAGNASTCCASGPVSEKRWKTLVGVIIILAAIGVGANSFLSSNSAQSYTTVPAESFSTGLTQVPAVTAENNSRGNPQTKQQEIALNQVLDSLQSLDTLAGDKDVVFLVLPGDAQISSLVVPRQVATVANNLWKSGQRIAVFTLKGGTSDHDRLVSQFSVKTFPSVVILGRQGSPSAVSGDISEARLYNAFVLAKSVSCCPTGSASCCPK